MPRDVIIPDKFKEGRRSQQERPKMISSGVERPDQPNVLFLSEVINCNDGIATYCQTLAAGLRERGLNVFMISGAIRSDEKSKAKLALLQDSFVEWLSFPEMRRFPPVRLILAIRKFIKEKKITVINVHGLGMLYLGRILSLTTGARLVATYHPSVTGDRDNAIKSATTKFSWAQSAFLNAFFPDRLILLSDENVKFIASKSPLFKGRISKIFGGANLSHFVPPTETERQNARVAFGFSDADFVCIMVSRLSWVKGHDLLIKAVRQIRETDPDLSIKCIFVGSGGKDREAEIVSFAHSGGARDIDAFRFVGFMSDVRSALWSADIFVLPSRFEGFPLGVAEAMSTGLVPIRTPSGGATDQIINGKTGFIVPFDDVGALHDAILRLTDRSLRQEMSAQCLDRARRYFGVEPMVDAMLGAYGIDGKRS